MSNAGLDLSILDRVRQRLANELAPSTPRSYDHDSASDSESDHQSQTAISYAKTQPIVVVPSQQQDDIDEEGNEEDDDIQPSQIDFGQSMLFTNLVTQAAVVPDLHEEDEESEFAKPTQKIGVPESQKTTMGFDFDFNSSSLFSNIITQAQKVPSLNDDLGPTQHIPSANISTEDSDKENVSPPQQQITSSPVLQGFEFSTQIINHSPSELEPPLFSQFNIDAEEDGQKESEIANKKLTASERLARITQLAQQKRQQREEKEQEENRKREEDAKRREELEADITRTSLTDEENDYLDDLRSSDRVTDSQNGGKYGRDVKRVQELINIAKRDQVIVPQFVKRKEFSKQDLLKAFESEDEEKSEIASKTQMEAASSSPLGLARSTQQQSPLTSPISAVSKPRNPMESYAKSLMPRSAFNNGKSENVMVDLDDGSSDEDDNRFDVNTKAKVVIPALSKEQMLSIKQKFIRRKQRGTTMVNLPKQMRSNMISTSKNHKGHSDLIQTLTKENIQQLVSLKKENPDQQILDDMEKDDEIMGSLLEREIERVNRVRKREKLREKAAQVLLNGNNSNYSNNEESDQAELVPDSDFEEVPDSDFSDDEGTDYSDEEASQLEETKDSLDKEIDHAIDEVDGNDSYLENSKAPTRVDDSYMFGAKRDNGAIHDGMLVTSVSTPIVAEEYDDDDEASPLVTVGKRSSPVADEESIPGDTSFAGNFSLVSDGDLFKNLTGIPGTKDISFTQDMGGDTHQQLNLLQVLRPQPDLGDTQADDTQAPTQADATATQITSKYVETQVIRKQSQTQIIDNKLSTQKISGFTPFVEDEQDEDEDDDINPSKLAEGRRHIRKNQILDDSEVEDNDVIAVQNDDDAEEDRLKREESMKKLQKEYEDRLRRKELKSRKKRKELERRGLKKLVEGEAEESEDEWQGLGGIEGDFSDDQGNSEDEKMIDNNFLLDLNDDAVKKKFMEQFKIKDTKDLEKLLDDIKNHRLSKRGAGNGFDIELSDEEDELLMRYRQQKLKQQNEKFLANKKIRELAQQEKSKAFFQSIQEDSFVLRIEEEDEEEVDSTPQAGNATQKDTDINDEDEDEEEDLELTLEKKQPAKKLLKIEESFVVKQLSFLSASREDEYERMQRLSRLQHGFDSSEEEIEDLQSLKSKCLARLSTRNSESSLTLEDSENSKKRTIDEVETDADDDFDEVITSFKKPSIIKTFKSFQEKQGVQIKDGKQTFSGVTVNKHYKVATGSKASITYMSKKQVSKKEEHIKETIRLNRNTGSRIFTDSGFD